MNKQCLLIIISFNRLEYTRSCIESIQRNTSYPNKILIIDNDSYDDTVHYLQNLKNDPGIDVIFNKENQGWIGGVNQGLDYGDYAFYCVMNNDVIVYSHWLDEIVNIAQQEKSIGLVNPQWEIPQRYSMSKVFLDEQIYPNKGSYIETDWVRGFCFLVKKSVIEKIGGLDKVYGAGYYDDWDYSVRATRAGFKCVRALGAFVYHYKNTTFSDYFDSLEFDNNFNRNKALFYNRWGRPLRIMMIYNEDLIESREAIKKLISNTLKEQDHVFCLRTVKETIILHTNCVQSRINAFLLHWKIWLTLMNNLRFSIRKRYNLILCSKTVKQKIFQFPFIRKNFYIIALDKHLKKDFGEQISSFKRYK